MVLSLATMLNFHGGLPSSIREQTGTVKEYYLEFMAHANRVHMNDPEILLACFINGLKIHIHREVCFENPKSLSRALYLAILYEIIFAEQIKIDHQTATENQNSSSTILESTISDRKSTIADQDFSYLDGEQQQQPSHIQFQIQYQHFRNLDQSLRSTTKFITETPTNANPIEGKGSCDRSTIVIDSDRSSHSDILNKGFNDLSPRMVVATVSNLLMVKVSSSSEDEAAEKAIPTVMKLYTKELDRTTKDDDDLTTVGVGPLLFSGGEVKPRAAVLRRVCVSELQTEKEGDGAATTSTEEIVPVDFLGWAAMEARLKLRSLELFLVLSGGVALGEEEEA